MSHRPQLMIGRRLLSTIWLMNKIIFTDLNDVNFRLIILLGAILSSQEDLHRILQKFQSRGSGHEMEELRSCGRVLRFRNDPPFDKEIQKRNQIFHFWSGSTTHLLDYIRIDPETGETSAMSMHDSHHRIKHRCLCTSMAMSSSDSISRIGNLGPLFCWDRSQITSRQASCEELVDVFFGHTYLKDQTSE